MGFEPIFNCVFPPCILHYEPKKTFFRPNQKSKMARNGKTNMNPTGSSHGDQLVAKRLTLLSVGFLGMEGKSFENMKEVKSVRPLRGPRALGHRAWRH